MFFLFVCLFNISNKSKLKKNVVNFYGIVYTERYLNIFENQTRDSFCAAAFEIIMENISLLFFFNLGMLHQE